MFTTNKPKPIEAEEGPAATPTIVSLGLPKGDLESQVLQPSPLESVTISEPDIVRTFPATQSPSVSISTLSDITIADTSDDESPIDPTEITPHSTFYLEDGNVEVLCGSTLFRIHTSILSFHSPALRQIFAQTSLASTETLNGCPRIWSSDSTTDFATLLKVVYFPRCVALLTPMNQFVHNICPQLPREEQSTGFQHIFLPPENHRQVRATRRPVAITRHR